MAFCVLARLRFYWSIMDNIFDSIKYLENEPLANHTTFRVGGPANYVFMPKTIDEIKMVIEYCKVKQLKYYVIGNGSNLLFTDEGFDGVIIKIGSDFAEINVCGNEIYVSAGVLLSKLGATALQNELTGFEFGAGIPGTVGGAVYMNAGAYGGEMKDVLEYVDILSDGEIKRINASELELGYRTSVIEKKNESTIASGNSDIDIVLGACIKLSKGNPEEIKALMDELKEKRVSKQPLEYPSAGSTFKRPEGYFAGKLVEDAGLKGYRVGGACVSPKHAGFVVNDEQGTAGDVLKVIQDVSDIVYDKFGVRLEPEVRIIKK